MLPHDSDEIRIADYIISRFAGDAFGAITTLPLFCFGRFSEDPTKAILDRYEVWRAYLIVAHETLRVVGPVKEIEDLLEGLIFASKQLRDAFLELAKFRELSCDQLMNVHQKICSAYEKIESSMVVVGHGLGIRVTFLAKRGTLREISHQRSLDWLHLQLQNLNVGSS